MLWDVLRPMSPRMRCNSAGSGQASSPASSGRGSGSTRIDVPDSRPTSVTHSTVDSARSSTDRALCTTAPIRARSAVPMA